MFPSEAADTQGVVVQRGEVYGEVEAPSPGPITDQKRPKAPKFPHLETPPLNLRLGWAAERCGAFEGLELDQGLGSQSFVGFGGEVGILGPAMLAFLVLCQRFCRFNFRTVGLFKV